MILNEIASRVYIMTLFIRSDGERFLLGGGKYPFSASQLHFVANAVTSDIVELQGADGALLAGQVQRPQPESFDGFVGAPGLDCETYEDWRRDFLAFFRTRVNLNYTYTLVYILPDGRAIQRRGGYLTDAPQVQELYQKIPSYHVAFNFEDVNYYEYSEDAEGNETYSQEVEVLNAVITGGGLVWNEIGAVWDSIGAVWEAGVGGNTTVNLDTVGYTYPVWEVDGPAQQPTLTNYTTGQTMTYNGNLVEGQKLVVDMSAQTAYLNGLSVLGNLEGDWVALAPGQNTLSYTVAAGESESSYLRWNGVLG